MTAWRAKLGDRLNGYAAEKDGLFSRSEAVRWLCGEALQRCPHSNFAKQYRERHPGYQPVNPRTQGYSAAAVSS